MSLKILSKKRNELFKREEVTAEMQVKTATPSRKETLDELTKATGLTSEVIAIDEIKQKFGSKTATITAKIYDSSEDLKQFEPEYKLKRVKNKEAEKKANG